MSMTDLLLIAIVFKATDRLAWFSQKIAEVVCNWQFLELL